MNDRILNVNFLERISETKKFANGKEWFKKRIDTYIAMARFMYSGGLFGARSYYDRFRALALLANGQLDREDIQAVLSPVKEIGDNLKVIDELPDDFTHKDIITPKIDIVLSMENKKPWMYRAIAYNKDAINSKIKYKEYLLKMELERYLMEMEANFLEKAAQELMPPQPQNQKEPMMPPQEEEPLNSAQLLDMFKAQAKAQGVTISEPESEKENRQIQDENKINEQNQTDQNVDDTFPPLSDKETFEDEDVLDYVKKNFFRKYYEAQEKFNQNLEQELQQSIQSKGASEQEKSNNISNEINEPNVIIIPKIISAEEQEQQTQSQYAMSQIMQQAISGRQDKEELSKKAKEKVATILQRHAEKLRQIASSYLTKEEIERYISRTYKDQSEIFANHILYYAKARFDLINKFLNGLKHAIVFGREIYYVDIVHDNVVVENVNPLYFDCDSRPHLERIEDGEWAVRLIFLSPTEVLTLWGDELKKEDIEKLSLLPFASDYIFKDDLSIDDTVNRYSISIPVFHVVWKAMRHVRVLKYRDENGVERRTIVDHDYVPADDEEYEDMWIPEVYEGYKLANQVYVGMGYCKSSATNIDYPLDKKLPYIGTIYHGSSIVERCKVYQYLYDVLMYKLERLLAQDMNKKVFVNMNIIPQSENMDMGKFLTMLHRLNIGFVDPTNTAQGLNDIAASIKEVDMSPTFDLRHILEIMNMINAQISNLFGVMMTKDGTIAIKLEEIDKKRENLKARVMDQIIECYRKVIAISDVEYIEYITDDMDVVYAKIHANEFITNRYHVYIDMDMRMEEISQFITQNAAELLRAGAISVSDFTKIARARTLQEAEEILRAAEARREQMMQQQQQAQMQLEEMKFNQMIELEKLRHKNELQRVIVNNRERRETIRVKQLLENYLQMPSEDINRNKIPDPIEIYNATRDAEIKEKKVELEREKVRTKQEEIRTKAQIEREWMNVQREGIRGGKEDKNKKGKTKGSE